MSKTLDSLKNMSIQEVYQMLQTPEPKMLWLDISYLYARVRAIEDTLNEKFDIDSFNKVMGYWLESIRMNVAQKK